MYEIDKTLSFTLDEMRLSNFYFSLKSSVIYIGGSISMQPYAISNEILPTRIKESDT